MRSSVRLVGVPIVLLGAMLIFSTSGLLAESLLEGAKRIRNQAARVLTGKGPGGGGARQSLVPGPFGQPKEMSGEVFFRQMQQVARGLDTANDELKKLWKSLKIEDTCDIYVCRTPEEAKAFRKKQIELLEQRRIERYKKWSAFTEQINIERAQAIESIRLVNSLADGRWCDANASPSCALGLEVRLSQLTRLQNLDVKPPNAEANQQEPNKLLAARIQTLIDRLGNLHRTTRRSEIATALSPSSETETGITGRIRRHMFCSSSTSSAEEMLNATRISLDESIKSSDAHGLTSSLEDLRALHSFGELLTAVCPGKNRKLLADAVELKRLYEPQSKAAAGMMRAQCKAIPKELSADLTNACATERFSPDLAYSIHRAKVSGAK